MRKSGISICVRLGLPAIALVAGCSESPIDPTGENRTFPPASVTQTTPLYLRGSGPLANPTVLTLDPIAPTASAERYKDSPGVHFSGGNPWQDIGTWQAASGVPSGQVTSLGDFHGWIGLKNSDDNGTKFDVRIEAYRNGVLVTSGELRCIVGVTRNAAQAKEITIPYATFAAQTFDGTTQLSIKVRTRVGTDSNGGFCGGHSNAVGLRMYFDAVGRLSRLSTTVEPPPSGPGDAYYPLNGNLVDVLNNQNASGYGEVEFAADRFGVPQNALRFDGNDSLTIPSPVTDGLAQGTVTFWMKTDDLDRQYNMFAKVTGPGSYPFRAQFGSVTPGAPIDNWYFQIDNEVSVGNPSAGYTESGSYGFTAWHKYTFSWNPTTKRIYLDDGLVAQFTGNYPALPAFGNLTFSPFSSSHDETLRGLIDDIRIYRTERTTQQIVDEYRSERPASAITGAFCGQSLSFTGNVLPAGWDQVVVRGGPGLTNDRLEAAPTDGGARIGVTSSPVSVSRMVINFDGVSNQSVFGTEHGIDLRSGSEALQFYEANASYNFGAGNTGFRLYQGTTGWNEGAVTELASLIKAHDLGPQHYQLVVTSSQALFTAVNTSTNHATTARFAMSPTFNLGTVDGFWAHAYETTGGGTWLDNLQISCE